MSTLKQTKPARGPHHGWFNGSVGAEGLNVPKQARTRLDTEKDTTVVGRRPMFNAVFAAAAASAFESQEDGIVEVHEMATVPDPEPEPTLSPVTPTPSPTPPPRKKPTYSKYGRVVTKNVPPVNVEEMFF